MQVIRREELMVQFEGSQAGKFPVTQGRLAFYNFQAFFLLNEDPTLVRGNYFIQSTNWKINIIQKNLIVITPQNSQTNIWAPCGLGELTHKISQYNFIA